MGSTNPTNAILPLDLGPAAAFDPDVFPLAYYEQKGSFNKGCYLIRATIDEMQRIKDLRIDLNQNEDFIIDTGENLAALKIERARLEDNRKTLNPFKAYRNYRAARMFHAASKALYEQTNTSEEIHRSVQVIPNTQLRMMDDAVSPDASLAGFSIDLPDGLNDDAKRIIKEVTQMIAEATKSAVHDPFEDNSCISQLHDDEHALTLLSQDGGSTSVDEGNRTSAGSSDLQQSRPTSPQTIQVKVSVFQNSIVTANSSNLSGFTHNQGDRHSGAMVTQQHLP